MTGRREREVGGSGDTVPGDGRMVLRDTPVSLCEGARVSPHQDTCRSDQMYMETDLYFKLP